MFELKFALLQDELNHDARDEGKCDRSHEYKIVCARSLFDILELLVDWVRSGSHFKVKVRIVKANTKNSLVHVLRVQHGNILRSHIDVVDEVVLVSDSVGLVDVVRTVSVGEQRSIVTSFINLVIEVGVILSRDISDIKGIRRVR